MQNGVGNIESSIFDDNYAKFGGAVFRGTTTSSVAGCTFEGNYAKTSGAAIYDSHVQVGALLKIVQSSPDGHLKGPAQQRLSVQLFNTCARWEPVRERQAELSSAELG